MQRAPIASRTLSGMSAPVGVVAQELLREQGVAAAAVEDRRGQGRIGVIAEPGPCQGGHVVVREAAEHDVLDGAVAAHVRQRAAEVVARPTGRRAGGRDDEELGGPWRAKQAAQCEQRALVGPLQVVDDQQDRLGKRAHERVERAEDTRADARGPAPSRRARPRSRSSSETLPPTSSSTALVPSASSQWARISANGP